MENWGKGDGMNERKIWMWRDGSGNGSSDERFPCYHQFQIRKSDIFCLENNMELFIEWNYIEQGVEEIGECLLAIW